MRFIALDFETASHRPDSACQIGVAVYDGGQLIAEIVQLIRPPQLYFSPRCIAVHGIRPEDVRQCPTWDTVWEEHQELFESYPIVAHNASFDLNVLLASLKAFGLECPYLEYSCSRMIAQRTWPGRTSYALKSAAEELGIAFRHHDALEDAKVCGQVVLAAADAVQADSLDNLEDAIAMQRGRVQFGVRISPRGRPRSRSGSVSQTSGAAAAAGEIVRVEGEATPQNAAGIAVALAERLVRQCDGSRPLAGKSLVLSGRLLGLDRATAVGLLERLGGDVQRDINLQTNYVIVGTADQTSGSADSDMADADAADAGPLSPRQMAEIDRRRGDGQGIRVLTQRQLLALLPGGAAAARAGMGV